MDFSTFCKQSKEEEEQKKEEEKQYSIIYNPNAFDEKKKFTISEYSNTHNKDDSLRTFVKPDGTIENHMTIELKMEDLLKNRST